MGAFDDLIPQKAGGGTFDDLVPQKPTIAPMVQPSPSIGPGPRTSTMPDVQPSWGQVAGNALFNLPGSLWRDVAVPTYDAFVNRPGETLSAIPKVIVGALENLPQPRQTEERRLRAEMNLPATMAGRREAKDLAAAVGREFVDAYGSENALKHTLSEHPGRVLMDAATVGTAGAALPGRVGQAASVLSKIDPLTMSGNALKYGVAKPAGFAGAHVLGRTTGTDAASIRTAGRAGRLGGDANAVFTENMRGAPVSEVVDLAKSALDQVRAERNAAYRSGMKNVEAVDKPLPFKPIDDALAGSQEIANFKGVELNPSAASTKSQIQAIVDDWRTLNPDSPIFKGVPRGDLTPEQFHTPIGLDALKRLVGDIRDSSDFGSPARAAAERVYQAIGSEIRKGAPEYAKVMADYSSASGKLKEATRTFSLGENATSDTAARKLLSATRNNVQTNFGERARLLDVLAEKEPSLPYAIAGQAMNSLPPRGIVANAGAMAGGAMIAPTLLSNPMSALSLAAFSPRIVGETVHFGGRAIGSVEQIAKRMGITPSALRAMETGAYQAARPGQTPPGNPYMMQGAF